MKASARIDSTDEDSLHQLWTMLVGAMRDRSELKAIYGFTRSPRLSELAKIERAIDGMVKESIESVFKAKLGRGRLLHVAVEKMTFVDDGDHTVTFTINFDQIFNALGWPASEKWPKAEEPTK